MKPERIGLDAESAAAVVAKALQTVAARENAARLKAPDAFGHLQSAPVSPARTLARAAKQRGPIVLPDPPADIGPNPPARPASGGPVRLSNVTPADVRRILFPGRGKA